MTNTPYQTTERENLVLLVQAASRQVETAKSNGRPSPLAVKMLEKRLNALRKFDGTL